MTRISSFLALILAAAILTSNPTPVLADGDFSGTESVTFVGAENVVVNCKKSNWARITVTYNSFPGDNLVISASDARPSDNANRTYYSIIIDEEHSGKGSRSVDIQLTDEPTYFWATLGSAQDIKSLRCAN